MANNHHKPQQLRMLFSYWKFAKKVAFDILSSQLREVVCQIWSHKGNWHFALKRSLQRNDNFVDHLGPTSDCHLLVSWENIFICNKNSWLHFLILRTLLKQNNALLSVRYRRCISTFLNNLWFRPSKPYICWMHIIKSNHFDHLDHLDHLNHLDHMVQFALFICSSIYRVSQKNAL